MLAGRADISEPYTELLCQANTVNNNYERKRNRSIAIVVR